MDVEVAIVGGGQAGLATSQHLTQFGIDHVVVDAAPVTGDSCARLAMSS